MLLKQSFFAFAVMIGLIAQGLNAEETFTTVEKEVYEALKAEHADVRTEWLTSILSSKGLTEDEFSAVLVNVTKKIDKNQESWLRAFAVAAIIDFGTTNSLDFLEDEVLHGSSFYPGISGYATISGFDDRCFNLLAKITADESYDNRRKRADVYHLLDYVLASNSYRLARCLNTNDLANVRQRALSFLLDATHKEKKYNRIYLDRILVERLPEYRHSDERRAIIRELKDSEVPTPLVGNYFRSELQKLEAEEARAKAFAESQGAADGEPESSVATADGRNESPRPNGKSGMVTLAVVTVALAVGCAIMFMRRRKQLSSPRGGFRKDKDF